MRDLRRRDLILVALTFAAGSVDAVVFLRLEVFTAVMTGNIVFLGLAIGQGALRNALRSPVALAADATGVLVGSRLVAMGTQAAAARALAPGMPTTYVTGTLTALLSELSALGGLGSDWWRRAAIVLALGV